MPAKSLPPTLIALSAVAIFATLAACQHKSSSSKDPIQPATNNAAPGSILKPNAIARVPLSDDAVRAGFATSTPDTITNPTCGLPAAQIETTDTVTLNIQDTPSDYTTTLPRPIPPDQITSLGEYANGANCGRWITITLGDNCTTPSTDTCSTAAPDEFNGATLKALITNGCQSPSAACRDDRYHVELPQSALSHFTLKGKAVQITSANWNTRQVTWHYTPTDPQPVRIGFLNDSTKAAPIIALDHLQSGVHSVEISNGSTWIPVSTKGDSGQVFPLSTTTPTAPSYSIRILGNTTNYAISSSSKYADKPIVYHFDFPSSCADKCTDDYTDAQATRETTPPLQPSKD